MLFVLETLIQYQQFDDINSLTNPRDKFLKVIFNQYTFKEKKVKVSRKNAVCSNFPHLSYKQDI